MGEFGCIVLEPDGEVVGEVAVLRGEAGREINGRGRVGVESRLTVTPGACVADVAWCRRDGGEVAMAFAFALLAAIAAATLLFLDAALGGTGVATSSGTASGLGQAFSSCFRDEESRVAIKAAPRSGQSSWNCQKTRRVVSRTATLGSPKAFFTDFSNSSRPPEDSIAALDRCPWVVRYILM